MVLPFWSFLVIFFSSKFQMLTQWPMLLNVLMTSTQLLFKARNAWKELPAKLEVSPLMLVWPKAPLSSKYFPCLLWRVSIKFDPFLECFKFNLSIDANKSLTTLVVKHYNDLLDWQSSGQDRSQILLCWGHILLMQYRVPRNMQRTSPQHRVMLLIPSPVPPKTLSTNKFIVVLYY